MGFLIKERFILQWCLINLVSFVVTMQSVPQGSYVLNEKSSLLRLFLLNNILRKFFVVKKNMKGSNASNCMVEQFQTLLIIKNRPLFLIPCLTNGIFL